MTTKLLTPIKTILRAIIPKNTRNTIKHQFSILKFQLSQYINRPNLYNLASQERNGVLYLADTHLTFDERQILFSLIRGLRPERVLEIGSFHGGSASIICAAMEDNKKGKIIGIDPVPAITTPSKRFFGRFKLIEAASPDGLSIAREQAGGTFDFAHLDGINIYDQALNDLEGTLPYLSDEAYILINNPFHYGVNRAVSDFIEKHSDIFDCGFLTQTVQPKVDPHVAYAGLRLLRHSKNPIADPQPIIERCYHDAGLSPPTPNSDLLNHDIWYCKFVQSCPHCKQHTEAHEK